jgi:ABC-type Fe3+ transport system substrate-binding protein
MVTAHPLSANAQKLHDWFLSDEGQQLIEDAGYVPLKGGLR